jgi:DNA-binding response OmpR family regulator
MQPQEISRQIISALAIGTTAVEQEQLEHIFQDCGWILSHVRTRDDARAFLIPNPVRIVITEAESPGGTWRGILEDLSKQPDPPPLLVTSRFADDLLWSEVLNEGGFDVLVQPLETNEVMRVIAAAVRHHENKRQLRPWLAAAS